MAVGTRIRRSLWTAGAALLLAGPASGQGFAMERVATGLVRPVQATAPPGDSERLFLVESRDGSTGRIRILDLATGTLLPDPFLSIAAVSTGNEQGLLGLAFHPDYASNRFFYVNYTDAGGSTVIERYQARADDPDRAEPATALRILTVAQPFANHNGGWLGFGPDGTLYVPLGDGGSFNDPGDRAQALTGELLGKILRLDVDADDFPADPSRNYAIPPDNPFVGAAGDDEIWALGLRNPYRASFDRETGDLWIGDVGQGAREEIDVQPAAAAGGANYGWRLREGTIATPSVGGPKPDGAVDPIYDYPHGTGNLEGNSVIGGVVYRGPITELRGRYLFADFFTARIWSLRWDGSDPAGFDGTNFTDFTDFGDDPRFAPDAGVLAQITSFGEDAAGNLYLTCLGGDVFRLTALPSAVPGPALLTFPLLPVLLAAVAVVSLRRRDA